MSGVSGIPDDVFENQRRASMSEATDDTTVELGVVNVDYYYEGASGLLRNIVLGLNPLILIEPVADGNNTLSFNVALSLIDHDEAATLLRTIADALEDGQEAAE